MASRETDTLLLGKSVLQSTFSDGHCFRPDFDISVIKGKFRWRLKLFMIDLKLGRENIHPLNSHIREDSCRKNTRTWEKSWGGEKKHWDADLLTGLPYSQGEINLYSFISNQLCLKALQVSVGLVLWLCLMTQTPCWYSLISDV